MRTKRLYAGITFLLIAVISLAVLRYVKRLVEEKAELNVIKYFSFSKEEGLSGWKDKIFGGRTIYNIYTSEDESYVHATSKGGASALYYKIKLDMDRLPIISWKWNAKIFPAKDGAEDISDRGQDDFVARVYIIFPAPFFTNTKAIEYIWSERLKEEMIAMSPYSKNLQLVVIENGLKENGEWVYEERDIYQDYLKAFGERPRYDIGAIAFMTDADSTRSSAEAYYDEIKIGYKRGRKKR